MTEENIESVKVLVEGDQSLSIAEIAQQTGLNTTVGLEDSEEEVEAVCLKASRGHPSQR